MTTGVSTTGRANRARESDEMSSNPHHPIGQNTEESVFDLFAQRFGDHFISIPSNVDKRFDIERLKALKATTFEGTTNSADAEK